MASHWEHLLERTNSSKNTKQTEKWHTYGIQTDNLATTEWKVEGNGTWEIIKKKKKGRDKKAAAQRRSARLPQRKKGNRCCRIGSYDIANHVGIISIPRDPAPCKKLGPRLYSRENKQTTGDELIRGTKQTTSRKLRSYRNTKKASREF
ncbi:hypothetical protein RUM43_009655 [Polyplax serrata]|uniref:Uncharacterized protein n=1 Tax=Polyplax serrata TaxID=468196 RepID=A0AAN8NZB5_POLSC